VAHDAFNGQGVFTQAVTLVVGCQQVPGVFARGGRVGHGRPPFYSAKGKKSFIYLQKFDNNVKKIIIGSR
jgi:hypothetical protein